ncbi:Retinol dehydrogenase 7 [Triplophysa tibetana]|uniref:Retinol dehydrogenase 7 n=1 Tax=Triplophysa tibetana TaxID=1572043 RepID=A0A5A9NYZ2_9TELE|nr:Retinol dehydrogenase 7 [Triplophysa tibetana]
MVFEEESVLLDFVQVFTGNPLRACALAAVALISVIWSIRHSLRIRGIDEKHVLVTGCDRGFGHLAAQQLDQLGFRVIAACLTEHGASRLRAAASPRLKTLLLNVTDSASVGSALEFVRNETGERGLWGLVNNAGISVPIGPAEWMQVDDYKKVLDVNLMGVIEVTLTFLPLLKKAQGRVVNVASILGRLALIGGGYCLSKWGVEAFSDSLRRDMLHFGVKVSIIEPGFFKTQVTDLGLIKDDLKKRWNALPVEVRRSYGDSYLQEYMKLQAFSMGLLCSRDISKVSSCMLHALSARHPRTRYAAGWDAKLFWIPLSYAPTCVADFIMALLLPTPKDTGVSTSSRTS